MEPAAGIDWKKLGRDALIAFLKYVLPLLVGAGGTAAVYEQMPK